MTSADAFTRASPLYRRAQSLRSPHKGLQITTPGWVMVLDAAVIMAAVVVAGAVFTSIGGG